MQRRVNCARNLLEYGSLDHTSSRKLETWTVPPFQIVVFH